MIEKTCEYCGKKFYTYPSIHKRFCSHECSIRNQWKTRERAKMVKIKCQNCGKIFEVEASDHRLKDGSGIKYCSRKCMGEAETKAKPIKCLNCGKTFYATRGKFCSQECACEYRSKNYKDHKTYSENGYLVKYEKGYNKKGNVKVHRAIMEEHLGRKLSPDEVVHHIDGNKKNNDISNLKVMTRGEHSRLHREKELAEGKKLFGR